MRISGADGSSQGMPAGNRLRQKARRRRSRAAWFFGMHGAGGAGSGQEGGSEISAKSRTKPRKPPKRIVYDPRETDAKLSPDLRAALKSRLSLAELVELEKQLRTSLHDAEEKACRASFMVAFALTFRVLHDRFGFGKKRKLRYWDTVSSYLDDFNEGRITLAEMLKTVEADGITMTWDGAEWYSNQDNK